ncbi:unnamed protein product (macronuclear) [Paramecium tetraurelia]|uniref:EF-hand domain-containing protein n=1 Tax=Paramecium tetraurelia TaxID=5888 RepID=A0DQG7_PARTE|nr:uncharacterized protein GSPATT00002684001 [Paramecium tetraurelia]CAK85284.1 unnamed protein product [Paramecium tetraurelia]|eukprot:XP_001452681.1 hypothetical protein (macronuclear) [Paramecium tetraurelia strain d4-2]
MLSILILDKMEEFQINSMFTPQQLGVQFCTQFGLNLTNLHLVTENLIRFIQSASVLPQYSNIAQCYEKYFNVRQKITPFKSSYQLSEFLVENKIKFEKSHSQNNLHSVQKENLQQFQRNQFINQQPFKQIADNCQTFREKNRFENLYLKGKIKQMERNKSRQKHIDKLDVLDENCTFRPNTRVLQKQNQQSLQIKQEKYYQQIFDCLDNDKDGVISKNCIDISKLNVNDVNNILGVLLKIENESLELNYNQFIQLIFL